VRAAAGQEVIIDAEVAGNPSGDEVAGLRLADRKPSRGDADARGEGSHHLDCGDDTDESALVHWLKDSRRSSGARTRRAVA
jgi:hypothetical protein